MCIIIDANMAGLVFASPTREDYRPIFDWIEKKDGRLVFGGRNADELKNMERAESLIKQWHRAGKAHWFSVEEINRAERELPKINSDDPHVLALARVSRARVLCTEDKQLMKDFQDPTIIPRPRGKIYRNASHKKLLKHHPGCRRQNTD